MLQEILYHGTEINRGLRMISNKQMDISRGDNHWLGDGIYFFEEDFFAYKWIYDMFMSYFKEEPKDDDNLFESYQIIEGLFHIDSNRIFNLDTMIHKFEFDRVYDSCKSMQKYSQKFKSNKIPDGVVLNIMFIEMDYLINFDAVLCTFRQRSNKYKETNMRINYIPQKQICIKKQDCISSIRLFDHSSRLEKYKELMIEYNRLFEIDKKTTEISYKYSPSRKRMY